LLIHDEERADAVEVVRVARAVEIELKAADIGSPADISAALEKSRLKIATASDLLVF
jgi:hypothetical protein